MLPRPPTSTLFPYTTLFRSHTSSHRRGRETQGRAQHQHQAEEHAHLSSSRPQIGRHTSELQSHSDLVCRLLLEKKNNKHTDLSERRRQRAADPAREAAVRRL